jgi:hypothetical protein
MRRREGWRPPACSCGKTAYRSQGRALRALRVIAIEAAQATIGRQAMPRAAYRCRECGAWHLTRRTGGGSVFEGRLA